MSEAETWTVQRLLQWTTDFFKKKEIDSPRLEAEILLADALGIKRIEIYTNFDTEPTEAQRAKFREFVKRRGAGEPVAYLVGRKEFFSIPFRVDRNVLIPRPETEQLVLETLDILNAWNSDSSPMICDVGTGSGAIAVALAKNWPKNLPGPRDAAKIIAVDNSPEALTVAEENARSNGVADRIRFLQSDLLDSVAGPLDVVVSNPPYVSQAEYDALPADVKNFEPRSALLAGPDGTEIIRRLVDQAAKKLRPGGHILIEGSPMIAEAVLSLMKNWTDAKILKDDTGKQRFVSARKNDSSD